MYFPDVISFLECGKILLTSSLINTKSHSVILLVLQSRVRVMVFNAIFNISVIYRVDITRVPGENH
jgi:hypothetical protein